MSPQEGKPGVSIDTLGGGLSDIKTFKDRCEESEAFFPKNSLQLTALHQV